MAKTDNKIHPGQFVKAEIISPSGLSITEAAVVLGITRQALSGFLNLQTSLSAEMAIRLEKAFGVSMETLMRMQNDYDISLAHQKAREIDVDRYVPIATRSEQPRLI